jgi:Flp pilus assembly CpaF family ATPase/CRP-like cAMP-binding protein
MAIRTYAQGDVIFREHEPCDCAFVLLKGEVELSHNGHRHSVAAGEMFGEINLLQATAHSHTATATSEVSLQVLSHGQLEALMDQSPPEVQKMLKSLARKQPQNIAVAMSQPVNIAVSAMGVSEAASEGGDTAAALARFANGIDRITQVLEKRCDALEHKVRQLLPATPAADDGGDDGRYIALTRELTEQLSNLGPIMPLLGDETVNDILINGAGNVFVERQGLLEKTDITFPNDAGVVEIAEKIVKAVGRKMDKRRPLVDARLLDGSRVNIIGQPLAVDGTTISIRKFSKKKITLDVMAEAKNTSKGLAEFLKVVGKCRLNIVISGGTGSGKTTLLNAMSQFIDPKERIVTIEDAAELQLQQPHVVRLETKPYHLGMSREEEVSIRDLVKNALRMRPDRIIVGEVRGPEAFDMMQAMNTGHEGSLTTVHANHPRDALSRLENMISMADIQIPAKSLRYQIASALHLIVQISRMRDGHRRVTYISEVVGMEGDMITMHDLFTYNTTGEDEKGKLVGEFKWSGIMPRFVRRIAYYGEMPRLEAAFGVKLPKNF